MINQNQVLRIVIILLLTVTLSTVVIRAQQNVEESLLLPNKGTIRVLLVFAEEIGDCGSKPPSAALCEAWQPTNSIPSDADDWFDVNPSTLPKGWITNYYYQASFGNYLVLGDYLPNIIQVDLDNGCGATPQNSSKPTEEVIKQLKNNTSFTTKHGLVMKDFDSWTLTSPGIKKVNQPDNLIDALVIIWRKHRSWGCSQGFGVTKSSDFIGASTLFNSVGSFLGGWGFFVAEYFHALFGGDNWHTGGGEGSHTFLATPRMFSTTAQSSNPSNVANAWDRQQMGWHLPGRLPGIRAMDSFCTTDVDADLDIATHPDGGVFCLRDSNLYGDAIRIKLPHIDYATNNQPVKNQYLILENHRTYKSKTPYTYNFDVYGGDPSNCAEYGEPGLYAYIQVGKDIKVGTSVYSEPANALGSWFKLLEPEGNWDYVWRFDKKQNSMGCLACNWGNANIPQDLWNAQTVPNPFTGYSDLFNMLDSNNNGFFDTGDNSLQSGLSRFPRDGVCVYGICGSSDPLNDPSKACKHNWFNHGDSKDSYRPGFQTRINIGTNPAPVPVYTYRRSHTGSNISFNTAVPVYYDSTIQTFENRRILLNGISVEILYETPEGNLIVAVDWSKYTVKNDVRWAGNIVLQNDPDDPYQRQSQINLTPGSILDLDQGSSPTWHKVMTTIGNTKLFAQPSALRLEPGTRTLLQDNAQMLVRKGSTLWVKSGAQLSVQSRGSLTVEAGAYLCVEPGAIVNLANPDSRILINKNANIGLNTQVFLSTPTCQAASSIIKTGVGQIVDKHDCLDSSGVLLKSDTVAFWPFDQVNFGSMQELAQLSHVQILDGAMACPGMVNGALCLDGLASYAKTISSQSQAALNLGIGDFSIEGWIRTNDADDVRVILDKRVLAGFLNTQAYGYHLFLSKGRIGLQIADGTPSNYLSDEFVADGKWHHIVVTVERKNKQGGKFFVDCLQATVSGKPTFDPTNRQGTLDNSSPLYLGRRSFQETGFWSGAVDEFSIYRKALSLSEVQALCHSATVGKCQKPPF